jgi:hypothetical protein
MGMTLISETGSMASNATHSGMLEGWSISYALLISTGLAFKSLSKMEMRVVCLSGQTMMASMKRSLSQYCTFWEMSKNQVGLGLFHAAISETTLASKFISAFVMEQWRLTNTWHRPLTCTSKPSYPTFHIVHCQMMTGKSWRVSKQCYL